MNKNITWILSAALALSCVSPQLTAAAAPEQKWVDIVAESPESVEIAETVDSEEKVKVDNEGNKILPSVTQKTVICTGGGFLKIPVDLGEYDADELCVSLDFADDNFSGIRAILEGNTIMFPTLWDFDQHYYYDYGYQNGYYGYQRFTKTGSYEVEVQFSIAEGNFSKRIGTDTFTMIIPTDSEIWNVSQETAEFDGSQDVTFNFENGTNAYVLQSISKLALFVDKRVGNLYLEDGFIFDADEGTLTIDADAIKQTLMEYAEEKESGINAVSSKLWVNAWAVTEGGEEVRFDMIDAEEIPGNRDVAWALDITEFKSLQASEQKTEQIIENEYSETVKKPIGSKFTQVVTGANTEVTFESSNPDVAEVDETSGVITCVGVGEAIITSKAAESSEYKAASEQVSIYVIPKTIGIKSVTSNKKGQVIVKSKAVAKDNDGYRIQYKQNGKTNIIEVSGQNTGTKTFTFRNLKSGKSFKVKICAYKKVDGKTYYGNYSKWKTLKRVR